MKIGIVSDVHCNKRGLLRALDVIGDVDELICLGDSIYEYRFSNEVVQLLRDRGAHVIRRAFARDVPLWLVLRLRRNLV